MLRSARQRCLTLIALGLGSVTAAAYEPGNTLPRPDQQRGGLVQPQRFALPHVKLGEEVRVVVFFYSASWCQPCKPVAAALRKSYAEIRTKAPGLQFITYSVDHSPRARADYLRAEAFPWPALGPAVIERQPWVAKIAGGTPQFQAFVVEGEKLRALTPAGKAGAVIDSALRHLAAAESASE